MKKIFKLAFVVIFSILTTCIKAQNADSIIANNMELVDKLAPYDLWHTFGHLSSKIPSCSGNELMLARTIVKLAKDRGLTVYEDELHNVLVSIPATKNKEGLPSVCIQGHIDMVCQKSGGGDEKSIFPLNLTKIGDTLRAEGTTLGADNRVGISAMIALIMNPPKEHREIELLFTVQEEAGLVGAKAFDYSKIKSKLVYNVDSEGWGEIIIGCAGGTIIRSGTQIIREPADLTDTYYSIKIYGLQGGHSGGDINKNRTNALKVLAKIATDLKLRIVTIGGGTKINSIPRESEIIVAHKGLLNENFFDLSVFEEKPMITCRKLAKEEYPKLGVIKNSSKILRFINEIPNGVLSNEPTSVKTSNNVGVLTTINDTVFVDNLLRSSSDSELDSYTKSIKSLGSELNFNVTSEKVFSPWEPLYEGDLLAKTKALYKQMFKELPEVTVTHGGLEAGIIASKIPGAQVVSFGPTIGGAHAPGEYVLISTVEKFYNFLLKLIE